MRLFAKATRYLGAALAFLIAPAQASIVINESQEITLSVFVSCAAGGAGEIVDLSGSLHTLITETINGDTVSGVEHFQPQGIHGTGEATGDSYRGVGVTVTSFQMSLKDGQASQTSVNRFDVIGQGPGNNFSIHETAHITFNANGTATVSFDDFTVTCQ